MRWLTRAAKLFNTYYDCFDSFIYVTVREYRFLVKRKNLGLGGECITGEYGSLRAGCVHYLPGGLLHSNDIVVKTKGGRKADAIVLWRLAGVSIVCQESSFNVLCRNVHSYRVTFFVSSVLEESTFFT